MLTRLERYHDRSIGWSCWCEQVVVVEAAVSVAAGEREAGGIGNIGILRKVFGFIRSAHGGFELAPTDA